ncbi:D-alanyl-lipoteichoic acid acyltransferase DltB, MBOAT superfamily [Algoriphagus locisalis]|uniref:D-alanyl-lipoteichoic acid acyltransferase DltB, MBOAT superfamily n=1 Tax=Algoriphagus locisalis TaxID=305507 RepID=A0A1I6XU60_9BACT|nr:MBOAT family O-acyltransferase [Algoriphagus locisalis]SFT41562.1 D-alanyl-lipoteichoic acid acyltransferase DltB, MBOAT superfamily [Algoriphagus locisalis]
MLFNSYEYLIFLPVVFLLYWYVFSKNLKARNLFLLAASYLFYGWWDWRFLGLIALSSAVDYWCGLQLGPVTSSDNRVISTDSVVISTNGRNPKDSSIKEKEISPSAGSSRNDLNAKSFRSAAVEEISKSKIFSLFNGRKLYLTISLLFNLGLLAFFKYFNFFIESTTDLISFLGFQPNIHTLNIILPVGISFYTFQTLSYTIDAYRGKLEPTKDPIAFFAYVSFFPQLVAGPIERASNLLPQFFQKKSFDYTMAMDGMRQILWGLFMKVVIADNCAVFVNQAFNNPESQLASNLLIGAVFFSFQIYGDFAGYSNIAIGTGKLFGFHLMQNFAFPYFSRDIAEFWRRWHISLSTWFRDYLYIPLGGSKGSKFQSLRNILIIFLVSGFWHGANWTFIAWGGINAVLFIPLFWFGKNRVHLGIVAQNRAFPTFYELGQVLLTFSVTTLAWIFFRSPDLSTAGTYLSQLFSASILTKPQMDIRVYLFICWVLIFIILEWMGRREEYAIQKMAFSKPALIRYGLYYGLVMAVFLFARKEQEFIYFQF